LGLLPGADHLLSAICSARILAYVTWPIYRCARNPFGRFSGTAAFLMTLLAACAVLLPLLWLPAMVQDEFVRAYKLAANYLTQDPHALPPVHRNIPWAEPRLQEALDRYSVDPTALEQQIAGRMQRWASHLPGVFAIVGSNLGRLSLTVFTLFFFIATATCWFDRASRSRGVLPANG
jgi:predicted PurR-regulated permease PerM